MAALQKEALAFVESTLDEKLSPDFGEALKDGVALCNMLNKLKPGSCKKPKASKMPFVCMENINSFTDAAKKLGVTDENLFVTVDLWEASNLKQVAQCVVALKRKLGFGYDKGAGEQVETRLAGDDTVVGGGGPKQARALDCRECNRAISAAPVIKPYGNYHPKCFNCKKCGKNLHQQNNHDFNEQPYCDKCILIVNPKARVTAKTKDKGFRFQ
eukprot:m.337877 g.337877  ORF g.337877 m.337877 type:complete len:214 (+) comp19808_c0_seq1:137-778(+)